MNDKLVAYVGAIVAMLSLVGLLFALGSAWGDLKARVTALENTERYLHGTIRVPEGGK